MGLARLGKRYKAGKARLHGVSTNKHEQAGTKAGWDAPERTRSKRIRQAKANRRGKTGTKKDHPKRVAWCFWRLAGRT